MLRIATILALFLLSATGSSAAEITVILSGTKYFLVTKDSNGNVTSRPITVQIWTLDTDPGTVPVTPPVVPPVTPPVNPPVDPPPGPVALSALIKSATDKVVQDEPTRTNTKTALAKLYRTMAGLPLTSHDQLVTATDTIFVNLKLPQVWLDWKKEVDKAVAIYTSIDDIKKAWNTIAATLEVQ